MSIEVEGNAECRQFLEQWLAETEKGLVSWIAVVGCLDCNNVSYDWAGDGGACIGGLQGLKLLHQKITTDIRGSKELAEKALSNK